MKNRTRLLYLTILLSIPIVSIAGNEDRAGQAGASELLINPWARSTGLSGSNAGHVNGLEAMFGNVAGIALTRKMEVAFTHTSWLNGSQIAVNSFGLTQKAGKTGVIGLSVMAMNFGQIPITTVDNPDGGIGTFSPSLMNLNMAYGKAFSESIYGGINVKLISEAIADISAQGIALDAGIQYITGDREHIKFGIALKNVGSKLKFSGDGLSFKGLMNATAGNTITVEQRSAQFDLPSLINIGAAYDIHFSEEDVHLVTLSSTFTSNSFTKDQYSGGLEYGFRKIFFLRAGFTWEKGLMARSSRTTAFTGPAAGFSLHIPLNKENGSVLSIDYSYRTTDPFDGNHCIGAMIAL